MRLLPLLLLFGCSRRHAPEINGKCSRRAPEAGVAGGVAQEKVDLKWYYDKKQDLSWAGPIEYILADDVVSFAVTVDAGDTPTGILWLANNGEAVIDGSGETKWGDPVRAALDSWADTGGDSGGSATGDSGWVPDGDGWGADPLYHWPTPAGTVRMPIDSSTAPQPGCLAMLPVAQGDLRGEDGKFRMITKRSAATHDSLNVNLILMEGSGISEDEAWAAVDEMTRVYDAGNGPSTGDLQMWLDALGGGATQVPSSGTEINEMRSRAYGGTDALNIFFIEDFAHEAGTLGIAAGIPGPMGIQNTAGSGVVVSVYGHLTGDGVVDTALMGGTMAHELGHQLGLYHSTEAEGETFDVITDTPECDAATHDVDNDGYVIAEECVDADGANFMFWTAGDLVQEDISPLQAAMLDASPPAH